MSNGGAAVLTAPSAAALAVIRLSGPGVGPFLARRFSRPTSAGRAVHGDLADAAGATVDDAVVVRVDEHTADLSVHGGPYVVRAVLALAERDGFTVAPPVEPDAVLAALPTAPTSAAVRLLLAQPAAWAAVRRRNNPAEWRAVLDDPSGRWLTDPPTVAVVGPPNVGKSTLANGLVGHDRSITADAPGTTRDWVGGTADLGGLAVVLVDTPGVRATDDPIESAAIAAAVAVARSAELIVLVLDRSRPVDADAAALRADHPTALLVANKADRPAAWADPAAIAAAATTGDGIDDLRAAIRRRFGCEPIDPGRPRWWTAAQRTAIERAVTDGHGRSLDSLP